MTIWFSAHIVMFVWFKDNAQKSFPVGTRKQA